MVALLFILYGAGSAGDAIKASETTPTAVSEQVPQILKGSGSFISQERTAAGDFLLLVQDEVNGQRRYLLPEGLTATTEEGEIEPVELQAGDILDIDYSRSGTGDRVVTHLSVVIPTTEKEVEIEAPALESTPEEAP